MCDPKNQFIQFLVRYVLGGERKKKKKNSHSSLQVVKLVFEYIDAKISLCHRSVFLSLAFLSSSNLGFLAAE